MSVLYSLRDVTVRYGSRSVLAVNELDIHTGEVLAIVGPSGAGKSTLLRLLNFLQPPTTGTVHFRRALTFSAERDVPLAVRRRVTTVFQRPVLLKRTVEANVAYGLRLRGQRDSSADIDRDAGGGGAGGAGKAAGAHALRRRGAARGAGAGHGSAARMRCCSTSRRPTSTRTTWG